MSKEGALQVGDVEDEGDGCCSGLLVELNESGAVVGDSGCGTVAT